MMINNSVGGGAFVMAIVDCYLAAGCVVITSVHSVPI